VTWHWSQSRVLKPCKPQKKQRSYLKVSRLKIFLSPSSLMKRSWKTRWVWTCHYASKWIGKPWIACKFPWRISSLSGRVCNFNPVLLTLLLNVETKSNLPYGTYLLTYLLKGVTNNAAMILGPGRVRQTGVGSTYLAMPPDNREAQKLCKYHDDFLSFRSIWW
jgi:hypothetical protein